ITDTTVRFIQEARKLGIAGIYYDVPHANYSAMAESEYEVFGRPYDLQLLRAADELWFNILQITGGNPMFHLMADYPVSVVSWADRQSAPSLSEGIKRIKGAASGGIDRWALHDEDPTNMLSQAQDAIRQTDAKKLILTAGGPILITTPLGNLRKFRETAETLKPEKS
ncbi:MAG: uroporphyrinogen decarboxylase family protein, partial [Anaerolineae bacterium]